MPIDREKIRELMRQQSGRKSIGTCPACQKAPLEPIEVEGTVQDFCSNCYGIWLDAGEASDIAEGVSDFPDFAWSWARKKLSSKKSPRHPEQNMWELPYAEGYKLRIDFCETSRGIWLDHSEIAELEHIINVTVDNKQRLHKLVDEMIKGGFVCMS